MKRISGQEKTFIGIQPRYVFAFSPI